MHIDHLMDFLVVSKTMNLTLAADLRNTTQSNLSKRLRSLEKWIGHDLINRSNRPLSLTAYGEAFVPTAKAILEDLNSFRDDKIPWNQSEGGVLVATPHAATLTVLPELAVKIRAHLPTAFLLPKIHNHFVVARMLGRSECDLAIVTRHDELPLAEEFEVFNSIEIAQDELVLVGRPELELSNSLTLYTPHKGTYLGGIWRIKSRLGDKYTEVPLGIASEIKAHCMSGLALGLVPLSMVEAELELGRLVIHEKLEGMEYQYRLFCSPGACPLARQIWSVVRDDSGAT